MSNRRGRFKTYAKDNPVHQSTLSKFFTTASSKSKRPLDDEGSLSSAVKILKAELSGPVAEQHSSQVILPETIKRLQSFVFNEEDDILTKPLLPEARVLKSNPVKERDKLLDFPSFTVTTNDDDDDNCDDTGGKRNGEVASCSLPKTKFTPLEQQYLQFKKEYSDAILFIQCGYKYRIFGEDAQVASKELGFGCYMNHNFLSSSFPVQRLPVHVRRLVSKGYKVGVINQTETAATKAAGDTKNTLFSRKLHALYTQSTLIGEGFDSMNILDENCGDEQISCLSGYLMCIHETSLTNQKRNTVDVGIMAVNPTAGDVLYSSFNDFASRSELESCFAQVNAVELILPYSALSEGTENLISSICDMSCMTGQKIRIERIEDKAFDYSDALPKVSKFFSEKNSVSILPSSCIQEADANCLQEVLSLPPLLLCCLSVLISYLSKFQLSALLQNWRNFKPLSNSSAYMSLNAAAVRNLELLQNLGDSRTEGSLFWTVNFTRTRFGEKLLKSWLLKPLKDVRQIEKRQDAISAVVHSNTPAWNIIEKLLTKMPDLEKLLCLVFYHRCTCTEFITLTKALAEVKKTMVSVSEAISSHIEGEALKEVVAEIAMLLENVEDFIENINENVARDGDKSKIFYNISEFTELMSCKNQISCIEKRLENLQVGIARTLRMPAFKYSSVMGQKYLIEVKNASVSLVPHDWLKMNSTKQVSRFRSPEISELYNELQQLSEELIVHANEAWDSYLSNFNTQFYKYKKAISLIAELDCIFSLAKLAKENGYCRPSIVINEQREVSVIQGRNPVICKLMGERHQYVSNDTKLDCNKRCMIITGPNMGGKSSYVRQVALIAILAQTGSYVPAASASLPVFDGIYIRMGAEDDILHKRSTFMNEMQETSAILASASSNSLVILDELGRGTSTHDGAAIAHAVSHHLLTQVKCTTLFVTHYPQVASQLEETFLGNVITCHMAFIVACDEGGQQRDEADVTFLYTATGGIASKSYGINVARLAGIPTDILMKAKQVSLKLESSMQSRRTLQHAVSGILLTDELLAAKDICSTVL